MIRLRILKRKTKKAAIITSNRYNFASRKLTLSATSSKILRRRACTKA